MSTFSKDQAIIFDTFETVNASIDWNAVKAALGRIGRDEESFATVRGEIWARGMARYIATFVKTRGASVTPEHKAQAARYKGFTVDNAHACIAMANAAAAKPNTKGQRSDVEEIAFKSGRNAWDYIVKTSNYATIETRGGKRKPRTVDTKKAKATTVAPIKSDVPMTLPSVIVPKAQGISDVAAFYLSVRQFLIRAQANNAAAFTGKRGGALLEAHNAFVVALNAIEGMNDE